MNTPRSDPSPATGPDILARYLHAYVSARQLSDLDRPWGLGDESLDHLWSRLILAMAADPKEWDRIISTELTDEDRQHIVETITPLIFALPMRSYPVEVRTVRDNIHLNLVVDSFAEESNPGSCKGRNKPKSATGTRKCSKKNKKDPETNRRKKLNPESYPLGFLPTALAPPFLCHLRRMLGIHPDENSREVTISSGGCRRLVRVTFQDNDQSVVIRFLKRLPSPAQELC